MFIQTIKLKKNKANQFTVTTPAGEFDFYGDVIVKNGIKTGEVADNVFYLSLDESAVLIAIEKATTYLSGRLKTEKQVKDYLYKQGYKSTVVKTVLNKLKDYNLVDDSVYAESYIRSNPNYSKNKLKQKLAGFGVKSDLADSLTQELTDETSCLKNAQKYLKNKTIDRVTIEKLTRRLLGMGYNWDTIKSTLNQLKFNEEDFN